jgi:hypothetical protein
MRGSSPALTSSGHEAYDHSPAEEEIEFRAEPSASRPIPTATHRPGSV